MAQFVLPTNAQLLDTQNETREPSNEPNLIGLAGTYEGTGNPETIALVAENLRRQGWCFVELAPPLRDNGRPKYDYQSLRVNNAIKACLDMYKRFFQQDAEIKNTFACQEHFGYNSTHVREGMRLITGMHGTTFDAPGTEHLPVFDEFMRNVIRNLSPHLFGCEYDEALSKTNSCLKPITTSPDSYWMYGAAPIENGGYGMVDIVRYFNNPESNPDELENNVPGHNDPGILSFSMTSTERGLQLFDRENETWVDCPLNMGVLWLGNAAHELNPEVSAGRHRVIFGDGPRMSMWYEICARHQIPGAIQENGMVRVKESNSRVVEVGSPDENTFSLFVRSTGKNSQFADKRLVLQNLKSSMTMNEVLMQFEYVTGSPFSKSRPQRSHHASLYDIASGEGLFDRDKTLGELGLGEGDTVYMDWD